MKLQYRIKGQHAIEWTAWMDPYSPPDEWDEAAERAFRGAPLNLFTRVTFKDKGGYRVQYRVVEP